MRVYTFKGKAVPIDPVKESVSREEDRTPDTACDPLLQLSSHFPEQGLRRVFPICRGDLGNELQQAHILLFGHPFEHGQEVGMTAGQTQHQVRGIYRLMVVVRFHDGDQLSVQIIQQGVEVYLR